MRVKILGSASGLPDPHLHHASIWIKSGDHQIICDCDEGTAKQLLVNGLQCDKIDAIVITHFHPDHSSEIFMVIQMLYLQGRTKKLDIFLPEREDEFNYILQFNYLFLQKLTYRINIFPIDILSERYPEYTAIENSHLNSYKKIITAERSGNMMRSFSILIKEKSISALYTSDIPGIGSLTEYLQDLSLLIIDAQHPDSKEILGLDRYNIDRIILNHGISDELKKKINGSDFNMEIARENEEISL